MLEIFFLFTELAIKILNGILISEIFQKRCKTRANKIFILLSCCNISVGLFSVSIISIPLFKWDVKAFDYLHYLKMSFSYILVVIGCTR